MGQYRAFQRDGFVSLLAGGNWLNGVRCGPRAMNLSIQPWGVSPDFGARSVCDAA